MKEILKEIGGMILFMAAFAIGWVVVFLIIFGSLKLMFSK